MLETDLELEELLPTVDDSPTVTAFEGRLSDTPGQLIHTWHDDIEVQLTCTRLPGGYRVAFPGLISADINPSQGEITYALSKALDDATIAHLILDQVLPRLRGDLGDLVLHASAVTDGARVLVFAGPTGSGKSTLVASLIRDGWLLMSDDCLLISTTPDFRIIGAYPSLRLYPDSADKVGGSMKQLSMAEYTDKNRLIVDPACTAGQEIRADQVEVIFLSSNGDSSAGNPEPGFAPLAGNERVLKLLAESFCLDPTDPARATERFSAASALAECVSMKQLHYPHHYDQLDRVKQLILAD